MATALDLRNNLLGFDVKKEVLSAVSSNLKAHTDLNRSQMMEGKRSSGGEIRPKYRSSTYAAQKEYMNPLPGYGNPDLKLTGSFHKLMKSELSGEDILVDSSDSKTGDLLAKYGADVFGLTEQNKDKFATEIVYPDLIQSLEDKTGLTVKGVQKLVPNAV